MICGAGCDLKGFCYDWCWCALAAVGCGLQDSGEGMLRSGAG